MKYFNAIKYKKISFDSDILTQESFLSKGIKCRNILVIGGAGTIGSSYIKQILNYQPSKLTTV